MSSLMIIIGTRICLNTVYRKPSVMKSYRKYVRRNKIIRRVCIALDRRHIKRRTYKGRLSNQLDALPLEPLTGNVKEILRNW